MKPWPRSRAGLAVIASASRILKLRLGEACINAIEHGNGRTPGLRVDVSCIGADDRLEIEVHDRGLKRYESSGAVASIDLKLRGLAPLRGMGLMMIAQLVDEAGFTESADGGNHFRLVLYFARYKCNLLRVAPQAIDNP